MLCDKCVANKDKCKECRDHPEVQKILASLPRWSYFQSYKPACPRGYTDCVNDPAYILYHHPKWYEEMWGTLTPEEVIKLDNECLDRVKKDPNQEYYCYDDEDK